ncbi:MAG: ribonuclease H-like domain-containing protein [Patescibacteria group bacterium]|nr:ribonuclease H-like domain-containing protein [Patescibacteria group bacterium]
MRQVFFDVETKQTFEQVGGYFPEKLGVSFVGVCVRDGSTGPGEMLSFFEENLADIFPIFEQADVVIGFNSEGFDLPALAPYYSGSMAKLPSLDLMDRIKKSVGHRIGLEAVAQATLGIGKSGNGLDAIRYWQECNLQALEKYCLQDVAVTRDVYDFGLKNGLIKFKNKWNRLVECQVDFSFTPTQDSGVQMSLI